MSSPAESGNPAAEVLLLGEAPAASEIRFNEPFRGQAGDVLNDCMNSAQLPRRNCYILNVWPFQVVKDQFRKEDMYPKGHLGNKTYLLFNSKGFTPYGLECAAETIERIKASGANIILAMGKPAMSLCTGDARPIMKWRGSFVWSERFNKKVMITVHPAATLYGSYVWRYLIISDMEKANADRGFAELRLPDRRLLLEPRLTEVLDYISYCRARGRAATDLEVINHQVSCFSLCVEPSEAMCVPVGDAFGNPIWSEQDEGSIWHAYAGLMGDDKVEKVNQALISFDAPFLIQQNNIYTRGVLHDTMIAQKVLYPDFNKGLDLICSIYTREPYYKDEGKMWRGTGGDIHQFWRYNAKDAAVALEAWEKQWVELVDGHYLTTYNKRCRIAKALWYMTVRGWKVDQDALHQTHKDVAAKLAGKEAELKAAAKVPFNPFSPKQCASYFYGLLGLAPYKGKSGGDTTDDKAMSRIYRKHHLPEAKLVQECRALRKLKGTYLEINFDADQRLRCSWDPTGTWTGRLSSSQTVFNTGGNMQNLHPEFRPFMVADDD